MSDWLYQGKQFDSDQIGDYVGFVYLISNTDTNMSYIGKKHFQRKKAYQKNKKRRTMLVESDWKNYCGSNDVLKEHASRGDNITKEILYLCLSKGWMSVIETKEILNRDALIKDDYYNNWCSLKVHAKHLKGKNKVTISND